MGRRRDNPRGRGTASIRLTCGVDVAGAVPVVCSVRLASEVDSDVWVVVPVVLSASMLRQRPSTGAASCTYSHRGISGRCIRTPTSVDLVWCFRRRWCCCRCTSWDSTR